MLFGGLIRKEGSSERLFKMGGGGEFSGPITERSKKKVRAIQDFFRNSIENDSDRNILSYRHFCHHFANPKIREKYHAVETKRLERGEKNTAATTCQKK